MAQLTNETKPSIEVVHLARACNGLEPFKTFLDSYREHAAGIPHQLVIIFKGFESASSVAPWEKLLADFNYRQLLLSDTGLDLHAYRRAAEASTSDHLLFVNSFSEILATRWLEKLYAAIQIPGVGVAGATGSWESMFTNATEDWRMAGKLNGRLLLRLMICYCLFKPWPNYHIRTNFFLIRREHMLNWWPRSVRSKAKAYLFESARNSLTARIRRTGLRPVIVGRDGAQYEMEEWNRSGTFRCGNQENLLAADNQTRAYESAVPKEQARLQRAAWGKL
jgi:hypothetical protein